MNKALTAPHRLEDETTPKLRWRQAVFALGAVGAYVLLFLLLYPGQGAGMAALSFLPVAVTAWLWGHEHSLVIYKRFQGVLGRCVGHGAFPVPVGLEEAAAADVPIEDVRLDKDSVGGLFLHGYAVITLKGKAATAVYYQYNGETDEEIEKFRETW